MFCLQKPNTVQRAKIEKHVLGGVLMDQTVLIMKLQNIIKIGIDTPGEKRRPCSALVQRNAGPSKCECIF